LRWIDIHLLQAIMEESLNLLSGLSRDGTGFDGN